MVYEDICYMEFSICEQICAIEKQKIECPDFDGSHAEFIKRLGAGTWNTLLALFNLSWNLCPVAWKKSIIIPVAKRDKPLQ